MYVLMKTLAAQLIMPLPVSLGLFTLGGLLYWQRRCSLGVLALTLGVAVLFLASWGPVAERLLAPLETRYPPLHELADAPVTTPTGTAADEHAVGHAAEAIVVLGSGWQPNAPYTPVAKLSESAGMRLMEGIRLWRQAPELPLIVTGASRRAQEAPVARGYAEAARTLGVPDTALNVLDWPTDTGREASAVRERLGAGARIVLVTSASHMLRAMRHFEAAGLSPVAAPTHYLGHYHAPATLAHWVPSARHLRKTERALYEALGLLVVGREHQN